MSKYFVVFYAEDDGNFPKNDVIEYPNEIIDVQNIKEIESLIEEQWFGDRRYVVLVNYKKI